MRSLLLAAALACAAGGCATTDPDTAGEIGGAAGRAISGILSHAPVVGSALESVDGRRARVEAWRADRREAREAERIRGMQWELCVAHPEAYGAICRERFAEFRDFHAAPPAADAAATSPAAAPAPPGPSAGLMARVRAHEGFSAEPYRDASGAVHIGYGHNIDANRVLAADLRRAQGVARAWTGEAAWRPLGPVRQDVLTEMAYTLGSRGLSGFGRLLEAVRTGRWTLAAYEMADSLWAAQQGARALTLAEMMRTGRGG